ncbi:BON domain-containing protein [Bdellovibrio sp. ArHS]|uniref:BON domain-containing protein n=1 Tax=Bdellovibrio sp. ArHS TaxID=1569284 RepID=UPI0025C4AC4C|nr:BON domain-containing protein [Bdellovibrio sp. ArHS]
MKKSIITILAVGLSSSLAFAIGENMTDTELATKSLGSSLDREANGTNRGSSSRSARESNYDRSMRNSETSREPSGMSSSSSSGRRNSYGAGAVGGAAGVTAMDQASMGQSDTDLTRRVRQQLVNDPGLSVRAKNITVISENGNITLKGAVATNQEKARVEELAGRVQGARNVDNQTEVSNY